MNFFDRNRNELSKYFYDLSKTVLLSALVLPAFQEKGSLKMSVAGTIIAMIPSIIGMIIKREN